MKVGDCFAESINENLYLCMIMGKSYSTYDVEQIFIEKHRCGIFKKRVAYTEALINKLKCKLIERTIYEKVEDLMNKQNDELREVKKRYSIVVSKYIKEGIK